MRLPGVHDSYGVGTVPETAKAREGGESSEEILLYGPFSRRIRAALIRNSLRPYSLLKYVSICGVPNIKRGLPDFVPRTQSPCFIRAAKTW